MAQSLGLTIILPKLVGIAANFKALDGAHDFLSITCVSKNNAKLFVSHFQDQNLLRHYHGFWKLILFKSFWKPLNKLLYGKTPSVLPNFSSKYAFADTFIQFCSEKISNIRLQFSGILLSNNLSFSDGVYYPWVFSLTTLGKIRSLRHSFTSSNK